MDLFIKFLKEISKNNIHLIKPLKKSNITQNPVIFWYSKVPNLKEYRYIYLWKLYKQKVKLEQINKRIKLNKIKLWEQRYKILSEEIKYIYKKIDFLKNVYDFEANKIDPKYKISYPEMDYDYFNRAFFWVKKSDICKDTYIEDIDEKYTNVSKADLKELLELSKKLVPWLNYKFWSYAFMSHSSGTLVIPTKKYYTSRELVTLFFHEMTHFFRRYNNIANYQTTHWFSDYMKLEEWFALYNEYYYWKKILPNIKYNPFYDACYCILLNNKLNKIQKQEKIYKILKVKWFSREKSLHYYYRFYRYSSFKTDQYFLKDLIYTKWYKKVNRLLKLNKKNYNLIFSGRVWPKMLKTDLCITQNNFDTKTYFETMLKEIQKKI